MKRCSKCDAITNKFHKSARSPDGLQPRCISCAKEIARVRYQENKSRINDLNNEREKRYRREYLEYKKTLSCVDCGISDWRVIEFDHLGDKTANISDLAPKRSLSGLMKEINKCEPVCANCHRIRTHDRRHAGVA